MQPVLPVLVNQIPYILMQVSMVQHLAKIKKGLTCHIVRIKQLLKIMDIDIILNNSSNTSATRLRQEGGRAGRVQGPARSPGPGRDAEADPAVPRRDAPPVAGEGGG